MKHLRTFFSVSLIIVLAITALTGCKKQPQAVKSPFTEMTWENSVEDVIAEEGDDYTTYESIYNGTTYEFAKNYLDQDGTVKSVSYTHLDVYKRQVQLLSEPVLQLQ